MLYRCAVCVCVAGVGAELRVLECFRLEKLREFKDLSFRDGLIYNK